MTYLDHINSFNQWCESNYLPTTAQLMYFKLLSIFNKAGWCEWVQVDNLRLMALTDVKREQRIIEQRNKLLEAGLIEYQKGKKGYPNKYKLTGKYVVHSVVQNVVKNVVHSVVQTAVKTVDIKDKDIDKDKIRIEEINNIFAENNIFITPAMFDDFNFICNTYELDWIKEAVKLACKRNNRNFKYVEGILRSWKNKGYVNLEEIKSERKESAENRIKRILGGEDEQNRDDGSSTLHTSLL